MRIHRRNFLKRSAGLTALAGAPAWLADRALAAAEGSIGESKDSRPGAYPYLGRTDSYRDFRIIEPGSKITKVESWSTRSYGFVRITTNEGHQGWGQLSSYEADISATVLHRQVVRQVLGSDPADIDGLVDRVIDASMKFPWSYVCRALSGVDTAIWDLYGKIKSKPVCELVGGKAGPFPVYGSSMRRDITPENESDRIKKLRDEFGFAAFKVRLGTPTGHNRDAAPRRTGGAIHNRG